MIQSTKKIIQIGTSAGITIPSNELKQEHLTVGDKVRVTVEPLERKSNKHDKLMKEYDAFVDQYGQALKNLSDR